MRQVRDPQMCGGYPDAGRGAHPAGRRHPVRQRRQDRPAAPEAAGGIPVPAVRPVPQHDGAAEHRRGRAGQEPPPDRGGGEAAAVPAGGRGGPEAGAALRRAAAAVRPGPHPGVGAQGHPAGRALLRPGQLPEIPAGAGAGGHAGRVPRHGAVGLPRPGGGVPELPPGVRHGPGPVPAGDHPGGAVPQPRHGGRRPALRLQELRRRPASRGLLCPFRTGG